jgi:hypothetical protein
MARRVIGRERGANRRTAPRTAGANFRIAAPPAWQRGRRHGFSPRRTMRFTAVGGRIGGERQRRVRAARAS